MRDYPWGVTVNMRLPKITAVVLSSALALSALLHASADASRVADAAMDGDRAAVRAQKAEVAFLDYDWALNDK